MMVKKNTTDKKIASEDTLLCSGFCIYENGKFAQNMCTEGCKDCPGENGIEAGHEYVNSDVYIGPCAALENSSLKSSHIVTRICCIPLPDGGLFYACHIAVSDEAKERKSKNKTKKRTSRKTKTKK